MGSLIKTLGKKTFTFLVILPVFCISFISCSAKIDKDEEFNSLWNLMEAKMPRWMEYFRKYDAGFEAGNFYLEKSIPLTPVAEYSITDYKPTGVDSLYSIYYYIYSPDSTKFLDIYSANAELSVKNDTIMAWFQPDGAAILVDLKNGKESMFINCGTACGCDEAAWIDNDSFIITGAIAAYDPPYLFHTFIQYINLKEKVRKIYLNTKPQPRGSGPEYGYYGYKFPKFIK